MKMKQREFPPVKNKDETYQKLSFILYHYQNFTREQKKIFKFVIAECTLGELILSDNIKYDNIFNFNSFKDYFLYNIGKNGGMKFIHKSDVSHLHYQTKKIINKGFEAYKYLSN